MNARSRKRLRNRKYGLAIHFHCLIDDHPEIGRGLDIAREYGVADLDDEGEWVVGDLAAVVA